MVRLSRRRLLALASATALGGCMSTDPESTGTTAPPAGSGTPTPTGTTTPDPLPEDLRRVLDPFPLTLDGEDLRILRTYAPDGDVGEITFEQYGLDAESVDRLAEIRYADAYRCVAIAGSFDASTPETDDDVEAYREDGFFLKATEGYREQWTAGFDTLSSNAESGEGSSLLDTAFGDLLRTVGDKTVVAGVPTFARDDLYMDIPGTVDLSVVESFALGIDDLSGEAAPLSVGIRFSASAAVSEDIARELIATGGSTEVVSVSFRQRGATLLGTGTARVHRGNGDAGTTVVTAEAPPVETVTTVAVPTVVTADPPEETTTRE